MTARRSRGWPAFLVAGGAAAAVAAAGGLVTDLGPWYHALEQPSWKPPDGAFGPVWTAIFAMIAFSAATAWNHARDRSRRAWIIAAFVVNGLLNFLWSLLFFDLHRPDWALVDVVFLWLSIVVLVIVVAPASRAASWLLVPYLLWVTFAAVLNLAIVQLNAPFHGG